jgi:hypothetical protein
VVLHNYPLDTTLANVVILPNMDDLTDPARPCALTQPTCREKLLLQEDVEAELVRDHQNIHLVMTDAIIMADLYLRPWQSRVWLSAINMVLPDLIREEHSLRKTEDTLVIQAQWLLLLIVQATTDPTVLTVLNVTTVPIATVLIASPWVEHLLILPSHHSLQSLLTLNVLLWLPVMYLPPTADLETRLVTTEDLEIRDLNLLKDLLTFRHQYQHRCGRRKRLADNPLTRTLLPRARTLVLSLRRSKHLLDLQPPEGDEEVAVTMCLPSLSPVISLSLLPVLDVPLTRKCKILTMDAWVLRQNYLQDLHWDLKGLVTTTPGTSLDKVSPTVVLVMQEMCHTMLLRNLVVTATTDVLNMTVKARNNHSSKTNLHLRHLLKDLLRSKSL